MRIIYVHHALREKNEVSTQEDGIRPLGVEDAILSGKILNDCNWDKKVVGIYSSPYFRCKETARLVNQSFNVDIYYDDRLNEYTKWDKNRKHVETWSELQSRVRECIKDVVYKYNDDECVIFVTSGVNIASFISLAYRLPVSEDAPFLWVASCSPIGFDIDKSHFEN